VRDERDARDVDVAIFTRKTEAARQVRAHDVAVEELDALAGAAELRNERIRERGFSRARKAGEPDDRVTAIGYGDAAPVAIRSASAAARASSGTPRSHAARSKRSAASSCATTRGKSRACASA
jgi:hypothetical protein